MRTQYMWLGLPTARSAEWASETSFSASFYHPGDVRPFGVAVLSSCAVFWDMGGRRDCDRSWKQPGDTGKLCRHGQARGQDIRGNSACKRFGMAVSAEEKINMAVTSASAW